MRTKALGGIVVGIITGLIFCKEARFERLKLSALFILTIAVTLAPNISYIAPQLHQKANAYFKPLARYYVHSAQDYSDNKKIRNIDSETLHKEARNVLYAKSFEIANDYFPFGAGMGRFGSEMSRKYYSPLYQQYGIEKVMGLSKASNNYITDTFWPMVLGETGYFGLACYGLTLFLIIVRVCKVLFAAQDKLIYAFLLGTTMIFAESLFESLAEPVYSSPPAAYFIFVLCGIAFSLYYADIKKADNARN